MFFMNLRINFLKLFGLIVSHMERINKKLMSKKQSRLEVKPQTIPSLLVHKNHSIDLLNPSKYLWDRLDLRVPWSLKPHPFYTMPS